jgi:opacity protein-like surface antigen
MNKIASLALAALVAAGAAQAATPSVEAGVAYVDISGVRSYAAGANLSKNETSAIAAPFLRATCGLGNWELGLGYSYYGDLKGSGVAGSSDIFNEGGIASTVLTEVVSTEDIHEFNFDARYVVDLKHGLSLDLGPTLSLFHSRAKIGTRAAPSIRSFSDTELSLGGALRLNYQINERWSAGLGYRYAAPTDRHFHIVSLNASYKF